MVSDIVYMYLGQVLRHIEEQQYVGVSDIIGYVTTRPFNMKGQEFQELLSYPLKKAINGNEMSGQLGITIESTSDKKKTDLFLKTNIEQYNFSIKNYTTARFQISTLVDHLSKYESWFDDHSKTDIIILSQEQKDTIIQDIINDISDDVTLFALTARKKSMLDIYVLSLKYNFLNTLTKIEAEYADRKKTPHRRLKFYFDDSEKFLFSLDLGRNALNRGLRGENRKDVIADMQTRNKFFYNLLDVSHKDIEPFLSISQDIKNEAIITIIHDHLQAIQYK